ncbi:sulfate permease [Marinococcus sp. PL1-022]|uniref:SulP family inorganic anion transporter n=1 Tax=Marinococcus sp. PL1-022 TaxID=3095363 RepID=UPI0029C27A5B|nr:sulfate permease [Marinococcus sp. PL1-022]MDX6152778.1 sulfate permease [Marinococcus sp. PL1-022]
MPRRIKNLLSMPLEYNSQLMKKDVAAGFTIFIMIVPQGMAYAVLAGLPPVMGLYASLLPLLIYALFGGSKHLAIGPVAMASILVFSGVSLYAEPATPDYVALVLLLTVMVGVMQVALGLLNAAAFVKFISPNVISGFTSAVAIAIGMSQLGQFMGISVGSQTQIIPLLRDVIVHLPQVHIPTLLVGIASLLVLIGGRKIKRNLPVSLIVVVLSIAAVGLFRLDNQGVSVVGQVPQGLPDFTVPGFNLADVQVLIPTALTIALIAMMETLAITKTLSDKNDVGVDLNKEIRAIGYANIAGPFFSSYAVTGSFSRSAVSYRSGAASQAAMIITAAGVLVTLLFFTSLFYFLPYAVLAAIILVSVTGLINIRSLKDAFRVKPEDGWVWIVTFAATLLVGIQWGLLIGIGFSILLLLRHIARPNIVEIGYEEDTHSYLDLQRFPHARRVPGTVLVRADTRIHFSNVGYFVKMVEKTIQDRRKTEGGGLKAAIDMSGVNDIDTTGIGALEQIIEMYRRDPDVKVWFVELKGPVRDLLLRAGWEEKYAEAIRYQTLEGFLEHEGNVPFRTPTEPKQDSWDYMI